MIKNNKWKLIIASIITLLPIAVGAVVWNLFPGKMQEYWSTNGKTVEPGGMMFLAFIIPVSIFVLYRIIVLMVARDPKNKEQSSKVLNMVLFIMPVISLVVSCNIYAIALGNDFGVGILMRVLIGIIFIVIGNYMPKCRQNQTIGIKVKWTLHNEDNWNKTHRFTGILWVLCGVILLVTTFIPMETIMPAFLIIVLVMVIMPFMYSYVYYKRQLKSGEISKDDVVMTSGEKKSTTISWVIGSLIFVIAGIFLISGKFEVKFDDASITIDANYSDDTKIDYEDIEDVEYRETDNPGSRSFGFGTPFLLMGKFNNDEFDDYIRYSYTSCDSCVVIRTSKKVIVINGKDDDKTKGIYEEIQKKIAK